VAVEIERHADGGVAHAPLDLLGVRSASDHERGGSKQDGCERYER